jgi:hypothetical protein
VAPGEAKGPRVSSPGAGPVRQSEKKKGRKEQPPKSDSHSKKKDPFMERGERNEDNIRQKNCDLLSRREVFFGATKSQKTSVTPKIRKFRLSWGSQRYSIQHETENHTTLQMGTGDFVKIPKIGAKHKKTLPRSSPSHGTFTKKEERHRNGNLSLTPKKV